MDDFVAVETAVRQLQARYVDAIWRKDLDTVATLFTADAQWRYGGKIMRGPGEIIGHLNHVLPLMKRVLQTYRTPILEVAGETASSRTYVTEQYVTVKGDGNTSIGIYFERFVKQQAQWKFAWRLFQTQYVGSAELTGKFFENPDFGTAPQMPPLDAITLDHSGVSTAARSQD